ncbi:Rac-like GTP-binding protein 2 [Diplonema papillatum]|nr:Rac-like GTP-binding protein 2 [Diplonema papillatum]
MPAPLPVAPEDESRDDMTDGDSGCVNELPYMVETELEDFISLNPELQLSEEEKLYLRVRRRKLSMQRSHSDPSPYDDTGDADIPIKVVALGTDASGNKESTLHLFMLQPVSDKVDVLAKTTPCFIACRSVSFSDAQHPSSFHDVEVWVPPVDDAHKMLRKLYYSSASVFLFFFAIDSRSSFDSVRSTWFPEVRALYPVQDIPIILVGINAEQRHRPNPSAELVSSEEAVALAHEYGATKYIEVFSNNLYHVNEIMQQAVRAVLNGPRWPAEQCSETRRDDYRLFQEHLTVPPPVGYFDLMARTFSVKKDPDTRYFVSFTDAEPTVADQELTGPLRFPTPAPEFVRVKAFQKCRYPSDTLVLPVPRETDMPVGYFDVLRRGFFIAEDPKKSLASKRYHYTVDGSKPTAESPLLNAEEGLRFDTEPPLSSMGNGSVSIPPVLQVVALEDGKFRSKAARFTAPPQLPAPKTVFSSDRVLRVVSPASHVEYRYTLNGDPPTYTNSILYSGSVMLPPDAVSHRIKIAAFPPLAFPSRAVDVSSVPHEDVQSITALHNVSHHSSPPVLETEIRLQRGASRRLSKSVSSSRCGSPSRNAQAVVTLANTGGKPIASNKREFAADRAHTSGSGAPGVPMTKSALGRMSLRSRQTSPSTPRSQSPSRGGSPGGGGRTHRPSPSFVGQTTGKPLNTTHDHCSKPTDGATDLRAKSQSTLDTRSKPQSSARAGRSNSTGGLTAGTSGDNVTCTTRNSTLDFHFEEPIAVSHLTASTPGSGRGPEGYVIHVRDSSSPDGLSGPPIFTEIGSGSLQDLNGVQLLNVEPVYRNIHATEVHVTFTKPHSGLFRINNVQIHGKAAVLCCP